MARDGILVEASVTSNMALGAVTGHDAHPLPALVDAGVPVALNSDVPLHTGHTLEDELASAAGLLAASPQEIRHLQSEAVAYRFPR
jgi:adenosine deaminase